MMARFAFSVVVGFVCHQSARVTRRMPPGWQNLTDHTIGVVTLTPLTLLWFDFIHVDGSTREQIKREILGATGIAALGYGIGNALAWVVDTISN